MSEVKLGESVVYLSFENHKIPEFKEVKNKDYIYFGEDNLYPDYLIELYLRCAKHNAIINGKVNYIIGGGLEIDDRTASIEQKAIAKRFLDTINPFLFDTVKDFEIFNSISLEPIFKKSNRGLATFAYMPMSKIRTNSEESMYFYSNDWGKTRQDEKTGYKEIKPFDLENPSEKQLFVFKVKSPKNGVDKNVYGIPDYIGATAAIETDIEIANYHLNNTKSGFSIGTIINFNNGEPPEDKQQAIVKQIKKKHTGTDRAGGLVVTFNKDQNSAPTITPYVPNDLDKQFIEIGKRVDQEIFTAHKVTSPTLFGVATAGALGQRNEMIDAYELFQNTYVSIRQSQLESVINGFASLFGIVNKIRFKKVTPVKSLLPDSVMERIYLAYPVEQLAEMIGLPKIKTTFKADAKNLKVEWFKGIGSKAEDYEVLFEREFSGQSDEDCVVEFMKEKFKKKEAISEKEKSIVDLLGKDPLTPSKAIADLLKISTSEANNLIESLTERGYITSGGEPSKKGEKASEDANTVDIAIKYRYGWRKGFDNSDKKTSREFCQQMLDDNKLYSRSEIESLNNEQGLDVWESRGGWWNKGGANLPYCRHLWIQTVVRKK